MMHFKYCIVHLQAIASHLPVTLIKDYDTGKWAHLSVKLHLSIYFGNWTNQEKES